MRVFRRAFVGGELSPEMFGRADDIKYDTGLAVCRNFIVLPQGPVATRGGLRYVATAKCANAVRLLPFRYSQTQSVVIEAGCGYFRFHTQGGTIMTPAGGGLDAWDSGETYEAGDLVTYGGRIWYAVRDVPTGQQPDLNEYGSDPVITRQWSLTAAASSTPPVGYTPVGDTLPEEVEVGAQVYITATSYSWVPVWDWGFGGGSPGRPISEWEIPSGETEPVATLTYTGYTGVAVTAESGYWRDLGSASADPAPYEIASPYASEHLMGIIYAQSGDVMTLTHPLYPPQELRRLAADRWTLSAIEFGSSLTAPVISTVTARTAPDYDANTGVTYSYVATRVSEDQRDESLPGAAVSVTNQLFDTGAFNTITFGVSGRYNVYKESGGVYGFIGQINGTALKDDNIAPDVSRTPPLNRDPFAGGVYPIGVGYHQQRRVFAGSLDKPEFVWMSKTGDEDNFDYSIPVRDDDGIEFRIAARQRSYIHHLISMGDLLAFTDTSVWRISSTQTDAVTPTSITAQAQTYVGAARTMPAVTSSSVLYAAARGGHVYAVGYDDSAGGYVAFDLSLRAAHLFDHKTVADMAWSQGRIPILWAVSSDGRLLGMTYVPEQQVFAWHRHDTYEGEFESCCVVGEGHDDVLYVAVKRTIDGTVRRYIERMEPRYFAQDDDAFVVDSGLTYKGAPVTTLSGLDHLEGETVSILADGAVVAPKVVDAGQVTLDVAASCVHVGLPIVADVVTLPVAIEAEAAGQGRRKNVAKVYARVYRSGLIFAGPSTDKLRAQRARTIEPYGSPPALKSEEIEVIVDGRWNDNGQLAVRNVDPRHVEIVNMTMVYSFGG